MSIEDMENTRNHDQASAYRAEMQSKIPPSMYVTLHFIDRAFTTLWLLIKSGFWLGVAYIGYLCIKELAGQTTVANFILGYFSNEQPESGSSYSIIWTIVAGGCVVWAKFERWLRLRKVSSMSERIMHLETFIDRNRTSSGLTNAGETPMEEELP